MSLTLLAVHVLATAKQAEEAAKQAGRATNWEFFQPVETSKCHHLGSIRLGLREN